MFYVLKMTQGEFERQQIKFGLNHPTAYWLAKSRQILMKSHPDGHGDTILRQLLHVSRRNNTE